MRNETYFNNQRKLIKWDNPIAIADGYWVGARGNIGQFCMCPVFVTDLDGNWAGTWAENTLATPLKSTEMLRIAAQQIPDNFTIAQKMNWLMWGGMGTWGAPMQGTFPNGDSSRWMEATNIRMIATVYAGQFVNVIAHKTIMINLDGRLEQTPMSQIRTFQPSEWGLPQAWQKVTEVDKDNIYGELPKGTVYLPIYFGNRLAWVLDRWLEA
jgi:hypothetical protein